MSGLAVPLSGLALACIVALAVRVGYVLAQTRLALFDVYFVAADSVLYLELATNVAGGRGLTLQGAPTAYVGAGYPLFLAALLLAGADVLSIALAQCLIGTATVALAALCTRELALAMDRPMLEAWSLAAIAGAIAAVYPHLVFWTGYVLTETLFVFFLAAALLAFARGVRTRSTAWCAVGGAAFALAALTRPPAFALAAVPLLWLAIARAPRHCIAAFGIALTLPLAAWAARNAVELGAPIVTTTESGYVFYQGNSRDSNGGTRGYVDGHDFVDHIRPNAGLGEVERDALYMRAALTDIAADPAAAVRRWPAKVWNMWRPTYEGASVRNGAVTLATYVPLLAAGLGGLAILARRGPWRVTIVPVLAFAVWFSVHVIVTGMIRFRLPAELFLIIAAPFTLRAVAERASRRIAG